MNKTIARVAWNVQQLPSNCSCTYVRRLNSMERDKTKADKKVKKGTAPWRSLSYSQLEAFTGHVRKQGYSYPMAPPVYKFNAEIGFAAVLADILKTKDKLVCMSDRLDNGVCEDVTRGEFSTKNFFYYLRDNDLLRDYVQSDANRRRNVVGWFFNLRRGKAVWAVKRAIRHCEANTGYKGSPAAVELQNDRNAPAWTL